MGHQAIPFTQRMLLRRLGMAKRTSFAEMKAEQAKMTESWKGEGRVSEARAVADPEIVGLEPYIYLWLGLVILCARYAQRAIVGSDRSPEFGGAVFYNVWKLTLLPHFWTNLYF